MKYFPVFLEFFCRVCQGSQQSRSSFEFWFLDISGLVFVYINDVTPAIYVQYTLVDGMGIQKDCRR